MNAIRKLWGLLVVVLALNFLGMAVALALLAQRTHLDAAKLAKIKDVLFPPAEAEGEESKEPPAPLAEPTPMEQLIALLDAQKGKPTEQRVEDMREAFDQRAVAQARAGRELADRQRQLDAAGARLAQEREAIEGAKSAWASAVRAAEEQAREKGFRESLALYEQMAPKQAKAVLLQLDDEVALAYLRAMDARAAGRILKEFKAPPETAKAKAILELMRQGAPPIAAAAMGQSPSADNDPTGA